MLKSDSASYFTANQTVKIPKILVKQKKESSFDDSSEATTRFELVIRVLQTHALPLGYVAINDPNEIRTRVTAVKGRCLNRLTMGPDIKLKLPE